MNKRDNKGITLIALVITIIVLLILAGISISAVLGDNGILSKARGAKDKSNKTKYQEIIDLAVTDLKMETLNKDLNKQEKLQYLEDKLNKSGAFSSVEKDEINNEVLVTTPELDAYIVKEDGAEYLGNANDSNFDKRIRVGNVAITNADGEDVKSNSLIIGKKSYINFSPTIEGGTVEVTPALPLTINKNGTYEFNLVATVGEETIEKKLSVNVDKYKTTEKVVFFDGTGSTLEFTGINPKYNTYTTVEQPDLKAVPWKVTNDKIYASGYWCNRVILFTNPIENKGFLKCYVEVEAESGGANEWPCAVISFSTEINKNNIIYGSDSNGKCVKVEKFIHYNSGENRNPVSRQIIEIDIPEVEGEDFYVYMHTCDANMNVYKMWFE